MTLNSFEEIRTRRGRPAVLAAVLVWLVAVLSSVIVGVITGILLLFALGFPVQEITEIFGADPDIGWLFAVGFYLPVLGALVGMPLSIVLADRIGAWVLEARTVDEKRSHDVRIHRAVESVGLAAGEDPLVLLVDAPWIDAAALGRRRGRHTVVVSTAAAALEDDDLEMLAGGVLADALAGNAVARARLAAASPGLVPYVLGTRLLHVIRHWPRRFMIGAGVYLALWTLTIFLTAPDEGSDVELGSGGVLAPITVVFFNVMILVMIAIVLVVLVVWSGLLAALALPIGARARKVADIGMASLVRDPADWVSLMTLAGHRPLHPPRWTRLVISWLLPQSTDAADSRIAHLRNQVPGALHSLATVPPVADMPPDAPGVASMPSPPGSRPDWYADPWRAHALRWFDGDVWTAHVAD